MFKWIAGRQNSGYDKMVLLWSKWLKADIHLLRFNTGSEIKPHVDGVKKGKHYRLNIILKHAKEGGQFECENTIINWPRIKLFRPDINQHSVAKITAGTRYVLSIGIVR